MRRSNHTLFRLLPCLLLAAASADAQGRVRWRYHVPAPYIAVRPAVAKDYTVYAVDIHGTLHAVAPNGSRKWTLANAGRKGVDVASDGTVYTGDVDRILAVRPDGSVKWTYRIAPTAHTLIGPTVGPDGNVYANAPSGPGMISLTPAGQLRWATPTRAGRPWVMNQEVVFRPPSGSRGLQAFYSGHGELAQVEASSGKLTMIAAGGDSQPAIGPNGDLYSTSSLELRAFRPDGSKRWAFTTRQLSGLGDPAVGRDGVVYVVKQGALFALRPTDGAVLWQHYDFSTLRLPMVSPTNQLVLVAGRTEGTVDFLRAVDTRGKLLWQIDLSSLQARGAFPMTPARFTPDGNTAFIGTSVDQTQCYLYAIDTSPAHRAQVWTWGLACRGVSGKLPFLAYYGYPVLGATFRVSLSDANPSAAALHVVGYSTTRVDYTWSGAPGCTSYVVPDLVLPARTDNGGQADTWFTVPNVAALAGLQLFHQFAIADPVNRLGVVATDAGGMVIGN